MDGVDKRSPSKGLSHALQKCLEKAAWLTLQGCCGPIPTSLHMQGLLGLPRVVQNLKEVSMEPVAETLPARHFPRDQGSPSLAPPASVPFTPRHFVAPRGALSGQLWTEGDFSPPPSFSPALSAGEAAQPSSYVPRLATADKGLRAGAKSERGSTRSPGGTKPAPTQCSPPLYQRVQQIPY